MMVLRNNLKEETTSLLVNISWQTIGSFCIYVNITENSHIIWISFPYNLYLTSFWRKSCPNWEKVYRISSNIWYTKGITSDQHSEIWRWSYCDDGCIVGFETVSHHDHIDALLTQKPPRPYWCSLTHTITTTIILLICWHYHQYIDTLIYAPLPSYWWHQQHHIDAVTHTSPLPYWCSDTYTTTPILLLGWHQYHHTDPLTHANARHQYHHIQ